MKLIWLILLLSSLCFLSEAQDDLIEALTANFPDGSVSEEVADLEESISQLLSTPLNINSCSETDLQRTEIFTAFQAYNIIRYRKKYGNFFSIYELASIPGITKEFLHLIQPLLSITNQKSLNAKSKIKGFVLSDISVQIPLATSFTPKIETRNQYIGSPEKHIHRIKGSTGDLTAAMTVEKDPGELLMSDKIPEHLTGYVRYAPGKLINEVIVGNYKLHNGLGLVHGLGFNTRGNGIQTNGFRKSYAKPFASASEYDYYRGLYASLKKSKIDVSIYVSAKPEDMSLFHFDRQQDLFDKVKKTGYHRTKSELESSRLAHSFSKGASANFIGEHGNIGIAYSESTLSLSNKALDSLEISLNDKSKRSAWSFYGMNFGSRWETYFEASLDRAFHHAILAGARLLVHPALSAYTSIRNYGNDFRGMMPTAFGASNHPHNSKGLNMGIQIAPFSYARLLLDTDISKKTYLTQPNSVFDYKITNYITLTISKNSVSAIEIKLKNEPGINGNGNYRNTSTKNKLQIKYALESENRFHYETKLIMTAMEQSTSKGMLNYQQIAVPFAGNFKFKYRFMVFNTTDYESRIYLYEPGLKYSFLFPAWQGKGTQNILICKFKTPYRLTLGCKFSIAKYAHRHTTGSGNNTRIGNRVMTFNLQIQANLN